MGARSTVVEYACANIFSSCRLACRSHALLVASTIAMCSMVRRDASFLAAWLVGASSVDRRVLKLL